MREPLQLDMGGDKSGFITFRKRWFTDERRALVREGEDQWEVRLLVYPCTLCTNMIHCIAVLRCKGFTMS